MSQRIHRLTDILFAAGMALLAFLLYLRTLAPGLLGGDSGEFQFAAWLGGFAHPTGYPLYLALGWLWAHVLPWGDPAWRMNLFSALWGAAAVGSAYLLVLRVLGGTGTRRPIALAAAALFALTPTFWSQAVIAEVYTLHAAFVAAILLGLLLWADAPSPGSRRRASYAVAAICGFSLAHHRATILLAPAILLFAWTVLRRPSGGATGGTERRARRIVTIAACLLLPLLLYAYIPLRAPRAPYFRLDLSPGQVLQFYEPSVRGFLAHVSGTIFSGALGAGGSLGGRLLQTGQWLVGEFSWAGVALGCAGIVWLAARSRPVLLLTGMTFACVAAFNLLYAIGDIHVFYIPVYLVWTLWCAAGAAALGDILAAAARSERHGGTRARIIGAACALALLAPAGALPRIDRSGDDAARTAWERILAQPIPAGALLVTNDRDEMVPQWYLKYVEGRRTDLAGLFPLIQPGPGWSDVARVTERVLETGRPVLLIKPMPGLGVRFALEPFETAGAAGGPDPLGALVQVRGPACNKPPDHLSGATFGESIRLAGYDAQLVSQAGEPWAAVTLYWEVLRPLGADYTSFVHLIDADGRPAGHSDRPPGGVYFPTSLWREGECLRDEHRFKLNAGAGALPFTIEAGLYAGADELRHLGAPQQIGSIAASLPER